MMNPVRSDVTQRKLLRQMARFASLALAAASMVVGATGCVATNYQGNVDRLGEPTVSEITSATSELEVNRLVGLAPRQCIPWKPDHRICEWVLGRYNGAWDAIRSEFDTRYAINVICALRADQGQSGAGSCAVHVRKDRGFEPEWLADRFDVEPMRSTTREEREDAERRFAQRVLDSRVDLIALSELAGDIPRACHVVGADLYVCSWSLGNDTEGYGLVKRLRDGSGRVEMSCTLPIEGSPRAPGSCVLQ